MSGLPNRRDDEVRRLLDAPHPAVPADLAARAVARGRRIVHRRRVTHTALWLLLLAAAAVLAALTWPHTQAPSAPNDGSWWTSLGG